MTEEGTPQKKGMSGWRLFFLFILFLVLLHFVLSRLGINLIYRSDKTEIIQRPHDQ